MELFPSYGGAPFNKNSVKVIRLILKGCSNRPFFHISVQEKHKDVEDPVIEQIGNYDPLPNKYNEKLVAVNFKRLEYWLAKGAQPTDPVKKLLGLCGYFPVHYLSYKEAFLRRKLITGVLENLKITAAEICPEEVNKLYKSNEISSKTTSQKEPQNTVATEESLQTSEKESFPADNSDGSGNLKN